MPSQPPHLAPYDRTNIFARILRGEAPCTRVYEDEFALAFHDIRPLAPVHVLVVPKGDYVSNADFASSAPAELVVGFWRAVGTVAHHLGLDSPGYRLVANHGPMSGQSVFHFHVHIFGGKAMPHDMTQLPEAHARA